jgi:hypothetical protein
MAQVRCDPALTAVKRTSVRTGAGTLLESREVPSAPSGL